MKKAINKIKRLFFLGLLSVGLIANAAEISEKKSDATKEKSSLQIILYASNNDKKIIQTLPPTAHLIKIYQEGNWIKVGNAADGKVGWINQSQYQKALAAFNQPNIEEFFISQSVDKDNKPQIKIVAYQNGKAVSEKEAKALYGDMKKQQQLQAQYWQEFNQHMTQWQSHMLTNFFQDPLFNRAIPMPIVIIERNNSDKQ